MFHEEQRIADWEQKVASRAARLSVRDAARPGRTRAGDDGRRQRTSSNPRLGDLVGATSRITLEQRLCTLFSD